MQKYNFLPIIIKIIIKQFCRKIFFFNILLIFNDEFSKKSLIKFPGVLSSFSKVYQFELVSKNKLLQVRTF